MAILYFVSNKVKFKNGCCLMCVESVTLRRGLFIALYNLRKCTVHHQNRGVLQVHHHKVTRNLLKSGTVGHLSFF